jgi:hypothetical protein
MLLGKVTWSEMERFALRVRLEGMGPVELKTQTRRLLRSSAADKLLKVSPGGVEREV